MSLIGSECCVCLSFLRNFLKVKRKDEVGFRRLVTILRPMTGFVYSVSVFFTCK